MRDDPRWTCELATGINIYGMAPIIENCGNPAQLYKKPRLTFEIALCEKHKNWEPK